MPIPDGAVFAVMEGARACHVGQPATGLVPGPRSLRGGPSLLGVRPVCSTGAGCTRGPKHLRFKRGAPPRKGLLAGQGGCCDGDFLR